MDIEQNIKELKKEMEGLYRALKIEGTENYIPTKHINQDRVNILVLNILEEITKQLKGKHESQFAKGPRP